MLFFIDILFTFNCAIYDKIFNIIDDRKEIAIIYLQSWFIIDFLSIIPFEIFMSKSISVNSMVKIARIGRLYRLLKLSKLLKMFKILKIKSVLLQYLNEIFIVSSAVQRLIGMILLFLLMIHFFACFWILTATINESKKGTWLEGIQGYSDIQLYLTSFYFTIETVTTVGYGDFEIKTSVEKIFTIVTMLVGVIIFTFASGSLASIL